MIAIVDYISAGRKLTDITLKDWLKALVAKETVLLPRWGSEKRKFII